MEATENVVDNAIGTRIANLEKLYTPHCKTIQDIVKHLEVPIENSCKAVIYQKNINDDYVIVFLRGDYEVNETKLTNILKEKIHPAEITLQSGLVAGFIGPYNLHSNHTIIYIFITNN